MERIKSIWHAILRKFDIPTAQEWAAWERYKQRAFRAPPSPRFSVQYHDDIMYHCTVFTISAVLYARVDDFYAPRPQLYIRTRRAGVAKYILYEHEHTEQWPPETVEKLDPESDAHRRLCLRMRRCGAIEGEPHTMYFEERYGQYVETFQELDGHFFGWPEKTEAGIEPVWVLRWDPCADPILQRFEGCDTMGAYCAALQEVGAKYYPDVRFCPEARDAGLVGPTEWGEKDQMRWDEKEPIREKDAVSESD